MLQLSQHPLPAPGQHDSFASDEITGLPVGLSPCVSPLTTTAGVALLLSRNCDATFSRTDKIKPLPTEVRAFRSGSGGTRADLGVRPVSANLSPDRLF